MRYLYMSLVINALVIRYGVVVGEDGINFCGFCDGFGDSFDLIDCQSTKGANSKGSKTCIGALKKLY